MRVIFLDLSYEVLEETVAYPFQEMVNELAGIFGLYFGFSVISVAYLFQIAFRNLWQNFSNRGEAKLQYFFQHQC